MHLDVARIQKNRSVRRSFTDDNKRENTPCGKRPRIPGQYDALTTANALRSGLIIDKARSAL
jgi:hypothetical protein